MNTPITDAAWQDWVDNGNAGITLASPMKALELDRAALMKAVAGIDPYPEEEIDESMHGGKIYCEITFREMRAIRSALTAARANFPTP